MKKFYLQIFFIFLVLLCGSEGFAQVQRVCVNKTTEYSMYGYEGSIVEWHIGSTLKQDNEITNANQHSSDALFYKNMFSHTWNTPGVFSLKMQEVNNVCSSDVKTLTVHVYEKPVISNIIINQNLCDASLKASATVELSSTMHSDLNIAYQLKNENGDNIGVSQNTNEFLNLEPGSYSVDVEYLYLTDVVLGSKVSSSFTVKESHSYLVSGNITNLSCTTANDGAIDITVEEQLVFSGVDDYIDSKQTVLNNLAEFSMEGWVEFNTEYFKTKNQTSLFGQNDLIEFGFTNSGLTLWMSSGGGLSVLYADLPSSGMHHVAVTGKVKGQLKIYVDGIEKTSSSATSSSIFGTSTYTSKIGAGVWGSSGAYFKGELQDVRFWNKELSITEVNYYKDNNIDDITTNPEKDHLLASYPLNDLSGNTVINEKDLSNPAEKHGTGIIINPTYLWSNGATTEDVSLLTKGVYNVNITMPDGCVLTKEFDVKINADIEDPIAKAKDISISLDAAGQAIISADDVNNGSTDNCGIKSMTLSKTLFTCADIYPEQIVPIKGSADKALSIKLRPISINPVGDVCLDGYTYTVSVAYDISFVGTPPVHIYTLQAYVLIDGGRLYFNIPNKEGKGLATTSTAYTTRKDCATVDINSFVGGDVEFHIEGKDIPKQTLTFTKIAPIILSVEDFAGNISTCPVNVTVLNGDNKPSISDLSSIDKKDCALSDKDDEKYNPIENVNLPKDKYSASCASNLIIQYRIKLPNGNFANEFGDMADNANSISDPSGYHFPIGISEIIYRVIDDSGNISNYEFISITILERPNPSQIQTDK